MRHFRIISLLLFCMSLIPAGSLKARNNSLATEAFSYLSEKKYADAIISYEKLLNQTGDNPDALFNLGIAYYRTQRFSSAENAFERALRLKIEDPVFQSQSEYNIGNALFQQARLFSRENSQRAIFYLQESVAAFENAIELQSGFEEAESNLALTRKLLNKLQNKEDEKRDKVEEPSDELPRETSSDSEQKESRSSGQSGEPQGKNPEPKQPSAPPSEKEISKTSDNGGGTPGEFMNTQEAMMLLDSVEMDEKRITLSELLDEKDPTATERPDW